MKVSHVLSLDIGDMSTLVRAALREYVAVHQDDSLPLTLNAAVGLKIFSNVFL